LLFINYLDSIGGDVKFPNESAGNTDLGDEYNVEDELLFNDNYLPEEFPLPGILPTMFSSPLTDVIYHPLENIVVCCCVGEYQPIQV
jgi:hypothetical protein